MNCGRIDYVESELALSQHSCVEPERDPATRLIWDDLDISEVDYDFRHLRVWN